MSGLRGLARVRERPASAAAQRRARNPYAVSGFALPLALLVCIALGAIAAGAAAKSLMAGRIAVSFDAFHRALDVAEGGLAHGVELLASAHEAGVALPDSVALVADDSLNGFTYGVRADVRREIGPQDLNRNGVRGEIVRYARSWGYAAATASGAPGNEGEPVWRLTATARGPVAAEELVAEFVFERDPSAPDPAARGAWRAIPLRWSSIDDPLPGR